MHDCEKPTCKAPRPVWNIAELLMSVESWERATRCPELTLPHVQECACIKQINWKYATVPNPIQDFSARKKKIELKSPSQNLISKFIPAQINLQGPFTIHGVLLRHTFLQNSLNALWSAEKFTTKIEFSMDELLLLNVLLFILLEPAQLLYV